MMTCKQAWTCQQGSRGLLAFCSTSTANEPAAYKATVPLQPIPTPVLSTALSRPITWRVDHIRGTGTEL